MTLYMGKHLLKEIGDEQLATLMNISRFYFCQLDQGRASIVAGETKRGGGVHEIACRVGSVERSGEHEEKRAHPMAPDIHVLTSFFLFGRYRQSAPKIKTLVSNEP